MSQATFRQSATNNRKVIFVMIDTNGDGITSITSPTLRIAKNGIDTGVPSSSGTWTEISSGAMAGLYSLTPDATDCDTIGPVVIQATDPGDNASSFRAQFEVEEDTLTSIGDSVSTLATSAQSVAMQADLDNPDQFKADVSSLATSAQVVAVQADLDNPDQFKADVTTLATSGQVAIAVWGYGTRGLTESVDIGSVASIPTSAGFGDFKDQAAKVIFQKVIAQNDTAINRLYAYMIDKDGEPITGLTNGTVTQYLSKNGDNSGTPNNAATFTEVSAANAPGLYSIYPHEDDLDTIGACVWRITADNARPFYIGYVVETASLSGVKNDTSSILSAVPLLPAGVWTYGSGRTITGGTVDTVDLTDLETKVDAVSGIVSENLIRTLVIQRISQNKMEIDQDNSRLIVYDDTGTNPLFTATLTDKDNQSIVLGGRGPVNREKID